MWNTIEFIFELIINIFQFPNSRVSTNSKIGTHSDLEEFNPKFLGLTILKYIGLGFLVLCLSYIGYKTFF